MDTAEKRSKKEPALSIIRKLGGYGNVSEIVGCGDTTPYSWTYAREDGGTDGLIPQRHHLKLLTYARSYGIDLRAEDFLPLSEKGA